MKKGLILSCMLLFSGFSLAACGVEETPTPTITLPDIPTFTSALLSTPTFSPTPTLQAGATMISEKDGMVLLYVPAGEFWMGSTDAEVDAAFENCTKDQDGYTCERTWFEAEQPQHKVYLDAYWIDQTEVTNGMYEKCVIDGACSASSSSSSFTRSLYYGNLTYVDYPVIHVDWNNAKAYCEWAGRKLPSEAQWEKAARGTDGRMYPWGNINPSSSLLNYQGIVGDTTEVGSYPGGASPYGALDMGGNVYEWVGDWFVSYYYSVSPASNPMGPASGDYRVLRGGTWVNSRVFVRAAYRSYFNPANGHEIIGFRCVSFP